MAGCACRRPRRSRRRLETERRCDRSAPVKTGCRMASGAASSLLTEVSRHDRRPPANGKLTNLPFYEERVDLACAFRWTARLNMHEAVANHFSLAVNDDGTQVPDEPQPGAFLAHQGERPPADRRQRSRDAAPAPTRPTRPPGACTARSTATCRMRAASCMCIRSTRRCSPRSPTPRLPPIDQNSAMFFNRQVVDEPLWRAGLRGGGRALLAAARRPEASRS